MGRPGVGADAGPGPGRRAILVTLLDPVTPVLSLRQTQPSAAPVILTSPLDDLAANLREPDVPVFTYTSTGHVDRWRLAVLAGFDGANWSSSAVFRRMGATVALPSGITVPTTSRAATVYLPGATGQTDQSDQNAWWLPSQPLPTSVAGTTPWLDQSSGVLVAHDRPASTSYRLTWREPEVSSAALAGAAVDPHADGGFGGLGEIPPGIFDLATSAVHGIRPSFQAALVLERFLADNYKVATGKDLPTGAAWPQLTNFLLQSKRGTSEQFAAAYVVLARLLGIPARIAVGYRGEVAAPGLPITVHNRDVLAWPEVAVAGVGWVPLDPTRTAAGSGASVAADNSLAAAADKARQDLPPVKQLRDPPLPPRADDGGRPPVISLGWIVPGLVLLLALMALVLIGIPVLKALRRVRRRRATGLDGVVAAWAEARDLLRSHGLAVAAGMTPRDVAAACDRGEGPPVGAHVRVLAVLLDSALWSGAATQAGAVEGAWSAVLLVRRGLASQPAAVFPYSGDFASGQPVVSSRREDSYATASHRAWPTGPWVRAARAGGGIVQDITAEAGAIGNDWPLAATGRTSRGRDGTLRA
ncbi:transglutaminase family protein [Fodinicola feengrottensis]|uniref:transglutaminase family protein n=1 Tax=Fodinicola feengrottensis TaxID=435914 RepID=UPI002442FAEE|nr:transglutaminase domain-containing protein [Fodinicola feengrottensis]